MEFTFLNDVGGGGIHTKWICFLPQSQGPYRWIKGPLRLSNLTSFVLSGQDLSHFYEANAATCSAINQFIYCLHMIYWLITSRVMQPTFKRPEHSSLNDAAMYYPRTECAVLAGLLWITHTRCRSWNFRPLMWLIQWCPSVHPTRLPLC